MAKIFSSNGVWNNGIMLVRILTGWMIYLYGLELFHIGGLIDFMKSSGFPFPVFSAYAAKIIEFVGGIFLILGLFTKWLMLPLMAVMMGVIYVMNGGNILDGQLPFLFLLIFAMFFFIGPGKWSLDYLIERQLAKRRTKTTSLK